MATGPLAGRVALIYGGGRGIGAACAVGLAESGANVSVVARTAADVEQVCIAAQAAGVETAAIKADLTDAAQVASSVRETMHRFGRIDFALNLAAQTGPLNMSTWEVPAADWQRVMAVNVDGPYHLAQHLVPLMVQQRRGLMLFASTPFGDTITPGMGAYACSRAAANNMVLQLAAELAGSGVGACLLYPGITDTQGLSEFRARRPLQEPGQHHRGVSPQVMARFFLWACMQSPASLNGAVLAWNEPRVQQALRAYWGRG